MRTCGILSALCITVIAIPAIVISVLAIGIAQTVLASPRFVERLTPQSINTQYAHIGPYVLRQALDQPDGPDTLVTVLYPDATARATARHILPRLLDSSGGDLSPAAVTQMLDTRLVPLIAQTLNAAPICTADEERSVTTMLANNQMPSIECQPTSPQLTTQVTTTTSTLIRQSFDRILLASPLFRYTTQDVTIRVADIRAGALQSIMFPATLVIIVVALAVRSRRQFFGWIGGILLATTALGLPLSLSGVTIPVDSIEQFLIHELPEAIGVLLPLLIALSDPAFPESLLWSTWTLLIMFGVGLVASMIAIASPAAPLSRPRTSQPLSAKMPINRDGSTLRVKTDFETDAIIADSTNTAQLPPGLDTSKLNFGRRLPKIPQPTQQITDIIPAGDHTNQIPTEHDTTSLPVDTNTQELGPKEDSRATQRTDEHRF